MKNSNGLFDIDTVTKYAKALAKYGLDVDLDDSIDKLKDKYKKNHSLEMDEKFEDDEFEEYEYNLEDEDVEQETDDFDCEESESSATKAQEQRDLELSEIRNKNDLKNIRDYNSIMEVKNLRNAIILKEIIDNPRIEKRRRRHSRFRRGRI